jgi:membrane protein implicated in regulation of membrane protease activity
VDHGADHEAGPAHAEGFSLLAFIGVGKTPLMVVLLILFASIGLLGWLLNGIVQGIIGSFPGVLVFATLPVSIVAGTIFTSRVTRFIGQALPPISTTASRAQALVGATGTVISPFVDGKYGMVHLRDQGGTLISAFAVTDEAQPIPRGEQVLLVSYDAAQRRYRVTRK